MDEGAKDGYLRQLQAVHQLRDELELEDGEYRDLLERLTGLRSAKDMSAAQRGAVITYLQTYRELDAAVSHAEEARELLGRAFRQGRSEEAVDKEVVLSGELLFESKASLEAIMAAVRERHGEDVRLVGARELREAGTVRLVLEFDRLPF